MRVLVAIAAAALCSGCVTAETVRFQAKADQQALMRDGQAALVSRKKGSIVMIRPASRQFQSGGRPVFVVGVYNAGTTPIDFSVRNVAVTQSVNETAIPLKVFSYEELVTEERTRQVVSAMLVGVAAGANAAAASSAGYYNSSGTVQTTTYGRHGTYTSTGTYHSSGYSPALAAAAQARAAAQNEAMISATVEQGRQNLAVLERAVIKDHTVLPGEWYGGQLHVSPPASEGSGPKTYSVALQIGNERHEIDVVQEATR